MSKKGGTSALFVHIRLKEFNSFNRTCSISPLTSARCPLMQRDRTPRKGAQFVSRFEKVRREKRGGKVFKRRYKSICLQVLEYFIGLLEFVVYHDQFDPRDRRNQIVLRRLRQAEEQHQLCKRDILPLRDRPLLPRLPRHPYQPFFEEVQTDSEFAETVWISSESEEEDVPSGIWADPASTARHRLVLELYQRPDLPLDQLYLKPILWYLDQLCLKPTLWHINQLCLKPILWYIDQLCLKPILWYFDRQQQRHQGHRRHQGQQAVEEPLHDQCGRLGIRLLLEL